MKTIKQKVMEHSSVTCLYALKNMQSFRALFISLSLLRHESKDKTCKEYMPKSAYKHTNALTTALKKSIFTIIEKLIL